MKAMSLLDRLGQLESAGLIQLVQTQPEVEYAFRHALAQEATYLSLLKQDRRQLHLLVGEAMERRFLDEYEKFGANLLTARELAPVLAHHFDEGADARALKYYILAGDVAYEIYALPEAVQHYTRARDLALEGDWADVEGLCHLYTRLGRALELSGHYEQALSVYENMEHEARTRDERAMELIALTLRATVHSAPTSVRDPALGQALSDQALSLARELGDREAEAKALWNLMQVYRFKGHPHKAMEHGEKSLELARELGSRELVAYVLNDMFDLYLDLGALEASHASLDEAQAIWRELGNLPMLTDNLSSANILYVLTGEYEKAIEVAGEARRISETIDNLWGQSYSRFLLYDVYADRGEMERAIGIAEECIALAERAGFVVPLVHTRSELASYYGYLGDITRGLELAELAKAAADRLLPAWKVVPLAVLTALRLQMGDVEGAESALQVLRAESEPARNSVYMNYYTVWPEIEFALACGAYDQAVQLARAGLGSLSETGLRIHQPGLLLLEGKSLLALGELDEAQNVLQEARSKAGELGSRRLLWQILAAMAEVARGRGDRGEARSLRVEARQTVEYIADRVGSGDLRQSFLNLPLVLELEAIP